MPQFSTFIGNHWPLFAALLIILVLFAALELSRKILGFKEIQPQELTQLVNRQNAAVLDVREDQEFREGHIVNALPIPLSTLDARLKDLEKLKGRPIIAVCQIGDRSARACDALRKQGFDPVYKLSGGLVAWRDAKFPLTTK